LAWYLLAGVLIVALLVFFFITGKNQTPRMRQRFREQRDRLYAEFFAAASNSGKPRGLLWKALDWTVADGLPEPTLARDLKSGYFVALVPVTIRFEAVVGGDMEGLPAVGNLRNASAVFYYRGKRWHTTGRAVFNLNPDEAIAHFKDQFAPLEAAETRAAGSQ
jgi:hypothetical protein